LSDNLDAISKIFRVRELEELAPRLFLTIKKLGFRPVRVIMIEEHNKTLQFMIERSDLKDITVKECAKLSKIISEILDEKNLIKEDYFLEVSSPGIERPLIEYEDFIRFIGSKVKINLLEKIHNKIKFNACIKECNGFDMITFIDNKDAEVIDVPFSLINKARLLFDYSRLN
jgi:ribosome maturation factor RimP